MSLLFDQPTSVQTFVSVNYSTKQDVAIIGYNVWSVLSQSRPLVNDKLCISLSAVSGTPEHPFHALTCWATKGEQTDGVEVPSEWSSAFKYILGRKSVVLTVTEPIPLSQIFVSALSRDAYDVAVNQPSLLERLFRNGRPILRQGSVHTSVSDVTINGQRDKPSAMTLRYRLDMMEPVLQGHVDDRTNIIVTYSHVSDDRVSDNSEMSSDEDEGVEIDEAFLANSVVRSSFNPISPANSQLSNGGILGPEVTSPDIVFQTQNLSKQQFPSHDNHTLYLRTADLGRLGLLSGDWAVVCCPESSKSRLVRVSADDTVVETTGVIRGSPTLLYNLNSEPWLSKTSLSLHPSPFGSREPVVPTARSVTIARIASPFSINRTYLSLFLQALKKYFRGKRTLVKKGDIITVGIDTDNILKVQNHSSEDDATEHHPSCTDRANETVYFMITNVEHDVFLSDSHSVDTYSGSTAGELGCWVDTEITKMVQTGLERSRIPDVTLYLNQERLFDPLSPFDLSIPGSEKPPQKLFRTMSVIAEQRGVDFNLQLSILLKGGRGIGKFTSACVVARSLGLHVVEVNCYDVIGDNDTKTEALLRTRFENASACSPSVLVLRHLEAFSQTTQALEPGKEPVLVGVLRDCLYNAQNSWKVTGHPVIVCGSTSQPERVPVGILSCFKHEIEFQAPDEQDRCNILSTLLTNVVVSPDVSLSDLSQQTAAFSAGDLVNLVARTEAIAVTRASKHSNLDDTVIFAAGVSLNNTDFSEALSQARAAYSESIGAPKIPNVSWDDVGGLSQVKSDILDTIQLPLDHPELFAGGLKKRSGILLYGPPGTGKTLVAKAVATSFSLNFFSVKGPELLNMYIGESEANVRRVFQRAKDAKPCVIFFDELDSIAPKRGNHGDSGGVMDRIVSQLLAELDGTSGGSGSTDVFVIGATNRPDLLDPALLRPGRFDRMLYLGVSQTHEAQLNILEALTRKFRLDTDLDLRSVAEKCSFNFTGADFYALCSDALLNAMTRKAEELEQKLAVLNGKSRPHDHPHPITPQYFLAEMASDEDIRVSVKQTDFDVALRNLVPSVSQAEMDHYARIQSRFSGDQTQKDESQPIEDRIIIGQ
ncbi:AAA-domain-containing protein [Dendrothele bispora CBS 962.96]|uniref:Peroxisomal ATPase PEX6 n=1 Tax=Dendrothele bispora (strain CBS 962.96) TaxID=1314807 RepID=A0A4S8MXG3_DENBC|nr:AAA-domain-containing protein [Dendrothele bispora CBS 962.96]